jgi:hypothetical protein
MSKAVDEISGEIDRLGPIAALQAIKNYLGAMEEEAIDEDEKVIAIRLRMLREKVDGLQAALIEFGIPNKSDWGD